MLKKLLLLISLLVLLTASDTPSYLYNKVIILNKEYPGKIQWNLIRLKAFEDGSYQCTNGQCTLTYSMPIEFLWTDMDQIYVYQGQVSIYINPS
jgi:hypothetical protein